MTSSVQTTRAWRQKNPERYREWEREYKRKNRERINARRRELQKANPEKYRAQQAAARAKLPPGYQATRCREWRFARRNINHPMPEACEICNAPRGNANLYWDHDHVTGAHRGWLCNHCNLAIGQFKDQPTLLRAAADYLESRRPRQEPFTTSTPAETSPLDPHPSAGP